MDPRLMRVWREAPSEGSLTNGHLEKENDFETRFPCVEKCFPKYFSKICHSLSI